MMERIKELLKKYCGGKGMSHLCINGKQIILTQIYNNKNRPDEAYAIHIDLIIRYN